ncbi:hypothetical protein NEF87_000205 [Candidatus Lokiarchaeum ossiferum]|uniref:Uncharacterized protein n=1 Tax=Candidatus Lokiarchaeum ossiferum TaxID=2951803 RepID=A0ABY6HK72_9ARCH|nr:hypothetical protein NEF87_000205 [Candidatus Lokiarchaeum sp. B-35]
MNNKTEKETYYSEKLQNRVKELKKANKMKDLFFLGKERFGMRTVENLFWPNTYPEPIDEEKWIKLMDQILHEGLSADVNFVPFDLNNQDI